MTSRPGTFVFVQLPGAITPVVAARHEVDTVPVGPLGRLVYGRSYLSRPDALPLDPVHLPPSDQEFTTTLYGGMLGALRDTAPDAWGRMVLERSHRNRTWTERDDLLGASDLLAPNAASRERRDLAMACGLLPGRERWANRANLPSGCRYFGLGPEAGISGPMAGGRGSPPASDPPLVPTCLTSTLLRAGLGPVRKLPSYPRYQALPYCPRPS